MTMLKRLRKNLKRVVSSYLQDKKSRKKLFLFPKIEKYINQLFDYGVQADFKGKLLSGLSTVVDVLLTGLLIHYVINNRNFVAYGLAAYILQYYAKWFFDQLIRLRKVKTPSEVRDQQLLSSLDDTNGWLSKQYKQQRDKKW